MDLGDTSGYMLTTVDNPFNPFVDYDSWYSYDSSMGYYSAELLARVVLTSDDLSDADQEEEVQRAIDEIVNENLSGMHRKISFGSHQKT